MRERLRSATLSQLAFPGEDNLNFPWEKSHWDNTVAKSYFQKKNLLNTHTPKKSWRHLFRKVSCMCAATLVVIFGHFNHKVTCYMNGESDILMI